MSAQDQSKPLDPYKAEQLNNDTPLKERAEAFTSLVEKHKLGMLVTSANNALTARAMSIAARENGIDLFFFFNTASAKHDYLKENNSVNFASLDPSSGEWYSIAGKAETTNDPALVGKYYNPSLKAWVGDLGDGIHDGNPQDPRLGLIRLKAETVEFHVSNKSSVTKAVNIVKGAVTGDVAHVGTLYQFTLEEVNLIRSWQRA